MMIYVAGNPRTGSTFMMEVLHRLGYRIPHWYDSESRSGNEDLLFNRLSVRLRDVLSLTPPESVRVACRDTIRIPNFEDVTTKQMRNLMDRCWEDYDAIKDVLGGHLLAVACALGYPVDLVILTTRDVTEIQEKYKMVPTPFPNALCGFSLYYSVYGLVLDICSYWGVPVFPVRYPGVVEGEFNGILAMALGKDREVVGQAVRGAEEVSRGGRSFGLDEGDTELK